VVDGGAGRIREAFDRLDTNKDGSLTADEYNADAAISARRPFAEIDANKDGKASYEEVAAAFRTQRRGREGG
jgi:Ca2+-binding EF-hand superfamily protein